MMRRLGYGQSGENPTGANGNSVTIAYQALRCRQEMRSKAACAKVCAVLREYAATIKCLERSADSVLWRFALGIRKARELADKQRGRSYQQQAEPRRERFMNQEFDAQPLPAAKKG